MHMIRLFRFFKPIAPWLLAIWVVFIIVFSSIPRIPETKILELNVGFKIDYLLHFIEYFVLASLTILSFASSITAYSGRRLLVIVLGLIVFAVADETHQLLIPTRSFNYLDLLSNIIGIICGILMTIWLNKKALQD